MEQKMAHSKWRIPLFIFGAAVLSVSYVVSLFKTETITVAGAVVGAASLALFALAAWRLLPSWLNCFGKNKELDVSLDMTVTREQRKQVMKLILGSLFIHLLVSMIIRMFADGDPNPIHALRIYADIDSIHYTEIAQYGYSNENLGYNVLSRGERALDLVFFPAYPTLISLMMCLIPDVMICAYLAAWIPWIGAGFVVYRLFRMDMPHDRALYVLLIFCLFPAAIFYSVPMSESLFLLVTASSLYFARKRRWFLAGLFGMIASATRSAGVLTLAPLVVELAMQFDWTGFKPFRDPETRKRLIRSAAWLFLVPVGILYYLSLNRMTTGSMFTFMEYQHYYWGQGMTWFFSGMADQMDRLWRDPESVWVLQGWNLVVGFCSLGLMAFKSKNLRPSYTMWFMVYFAFSYGAARLLSGPRYMAVFFPLAIAIDDMTAKNQKETVFAVLLSGALVFTGCFVVRSGIW